MCGIEHQMTEIYVFLNDYLRAHRSGASARSMIFRMRPSFLLRAGPSYRGDESGVVRLFALGLSAF